MLWVNGLKTVDYHEKEDSISRRGVIGLQIHGGAPAEAGYRNIRIRELAESSPPDRSAEMVRQPYRIEVFGVEGLRSITPEEPAPSDWAAENGWVRFDRCHASLEYPAIPLTIPASR